MSLTIHSKIVDLDHLIPKVVDSEQVESDISNLIPWVYQHSDTADEDNALNWPTEHNKFNLFFTELVSYRAELEAYTASSDDDTGTGTGTGTGTKCLLLRKLVEEVYLGLDMEGQKRKVKFTTSAQDIKYTIGGTRYVSRLEGAANIIDPGGHSLPIIAFTGSFPNQTRAEFLIETFSSMLAQLTQKLEQKTEFHDQEVFVVVFNGFDFHIARGFFPKDVIGRVRAEGFSGNEIQLEFTRGFRLWEKGNWSDAARGVGRRVAIPGSSRLPPARCYLYTS
ncbi:hypothetical protein BO94DRAFT_570987 [Aspergillus sclerotioniger CBS 115572]|uniref:Uncharacterized protein n=1 Tax=Aspergillus sclerotioniger CBS 115572 TaxID=1450535 RepID=A0A317XH23_9EURO|nr:hypothetical protein BO94DRAFT_570987 [Aspergillus sclerotioniger CBS 115572]PWY96738.1 hypothetical protein BO94DRAFT_570987 [Aspergillus sclerotioniger CBS 115572]